MVSLAKSLKSKWVSIKAQSSAQYFLQSSSKRYLEVSVLGFRGSCSMDDLVIIADSLDELNVKLER